jgi:GAF domain-containing protein
MLEFLAPTGRTEHGRDFFRALVEHIGRITNVDYVIVDRLTVDPQIAATVAIFAQGSVMPNRTYNLKGAPCENVIGKELCCYSQGVQRLFPDDSLLVEMQAESYIGIPGWIAARTGQPTVVRDILNEPAAAWREEAFRCGYRCVVILPLQSEELTFAALVIGSIAVDVFDAEEVAILNELATRAL